MAGKRASRTRRAREPSLVAALKRPGAYDHGVAAVRLAETHISWVFLTGEYAYKVKKPVKFSFLDFTTLERRRRFCEEELRLNRRLAPRLYLGVVPIGGDPPRVGAEPALEYAVKMREFPEDARLDRRLEAGTLPAEQLRAFGARLAAFHDEQPPLAPHAAAATAIAAARDNFEGLAEQLRARERRELEPLRAWTEERAGAIAPLIAKRAELGRYRECHGDLHLENLLSLDGEILAFDALEFDAALREIDVASEAAFLAMDLRAHGRADLEHEFLTAYLEAGGDYEALAVLRFYMVYRALVRAKVRALKAAQKSAESGRSTIEPYLATARQLIEPRSPLLAITRGLSGSGKTYATQTLIGALRAVRVRSDLERKRLHGLGAGARTGSAVGAGLYDPGATERTYARLADVAATALRNGFDAIVDATFLRRAEREAFARLAADARARFAILDCTAPEEVLRRRIVARSASGSDASEADLAVLDHQLATQEPLTQAELAASVRIDTVAPLDIPALLAALPRA
ncbi:MAG TPA: AAA family ATPase [Gammaproteobacteria bacterium]|nr:AAA family ATPase [Gammaproteobacteria bacterium]